jgi:hypothetical protein
MLFIRLCLDLPSDLFPSGFSTNNYTLSKYKKYMFSNVVVWL